MLKHVSFYVVFLFLAAIFITAGCAKQDIVRKDEGIAPAAATSRVDPSKSNEPRSSEDASRQASSIQSSQVVPAQASAALSQKTSANAELQSALKKIYFGFDSAGLSESARATLTENGAVLAKEATAGIRIEGNCDERGSAEYNMALGERRAKAAQQYLLTLGVKSDRLSIISYGKEKPAVQGSDEAAWSKNRRDEFIVVTR